MTDNGFNRADFILTIEKADGGWILRDATRVEVVEEDERDEHGEVRATAALLWRALDMLGLGGSKHDPARVRIRIEGQDGQEIGPE